MHARKTRQSVFIVVVLALTAASIFGLDTDEAIRRSVTKMFDLDSTTTTVEVLSSQIKATDVQLEALSLRPISQKDPLGLFTVVATVTNGGRIVESGQVSLRIHKYADVLVATESLRRFDQPMESQFSLQRMDITSLQEQPVTAFGTVESLRMRRNLAKGQILTTSAIEPVPDIEVGREVSIQCSNGLFTIATQGTAQQAGQVGDMIRVKNRSSGKVVQARILDNSTVAIAP